MRFRLILFLLLIPFIVKGQDKITNRKYLSNFLDSSDKQKSILIVGENHASAAGAKIYPQLIQYLNKNNDLRALMIEFGPSEAYFYTKYLETGNEKHLNYTIYAGSYKYWREAWRKIYEYNKKLKHPLKIIGVDFDRTRTLAYALFSMFSQYSERPYFMDSLMDVIRTDEFYKKYTIGYPTETDKKWTSNTKSLLKKNIGELKLLLNEQHFEFIEQIINNKAVGYDDDRELALGENVLSLVNNSEEENFLMLIGRSHAYIHAIYDDNDRLATILNRDSTVKLLTGVILFQNSQLKSSSNKEAVTLFEIKNKIPWKEYYSEINQKGSKDFTVIPLCNSLAPLNSYTSYIILARRQVSNKIIE